MTDHINDGGPAFPPSRDPYSYPSGMTLRDYFAAKALGGMLADLPQSCYGLDWGSAVAFHAYALADAMLRAREVKP